MDIHITLVEPSAFRTAFTWDAHMRPAQRIDARRPMVGPFEAYHETSIGQHPGATVGAI